MLVVVLALPTVTLSLHPLLASLLSTTALLGSTLQLPPPRGLA
jgi:hypothetical protein